MTAGKGTADVGVRAGYASAIAKDKMKPICHEGIL